jgi:hypothetical protein
MALSSHQHPLQIQERPQIRLKYPLLHKYNIPVFEKHVVDAFLNEISIILVGMVHANGQKALPCREAFDEEDATVAETGASWIIHYLSQCYENQFVSAAIVKGIAHDKKEVMSVPQTVAMLHDAGLNTKSSRILFRHVEQFLGYTIFAPEYKCWRYFEGLGYQPREIVYELKDKTKIRYWYKALDLML